MKYDIAILGPKDRKICTSDGIMIDTTSKSKKWREYFSPFYLGPVRVPGFNPYCLKMENAWQFSKVYPEHVGYDGLPNEIWYKWREKGMLDWRAHRYPMGKGAKPKYSYWGGSSMGYISARINIYIPEYSRLISNNDGFKYLKKECEKGNKIYLWDFDGYNHKEIGMSYEDVKLNEDRPMGHAFVIAMKLQELI